MKATMLKYDDEQDFLPVRDFLVETYSLLDRPVNWRIDRWNYARYYVMPMIGIPSTDPVPPQASRKAIAVWEELTRIWKDGEGKVLAVAAFEYPWPGDLFALRHPEHDSLLEEMFEYAEANLVHPEKKTLRIHIYEHDEPLTAMAQKRGYEKKPEWFEEDTEFLIRGDLPQASLPEGFTIQTMAGENDLERRRKAFGRGFNHEDPDEWPSLFSYQELQRAPDYRKDQDLYVVGPEGEFVSFCILWWDERNRMGILEPVGTVPEHRRKGLARAVVCEAIRKAATLGAEKVVVGAGLEFYLAIGFEKRYRNCVWVKEF